MGVEGGIAWPRVGARVGRWNTFSIRLLLLACWLGVELVALSLWLDGESITAQAGLLAGIRNWGAFGLRFVVGFAAVLGILLYSRGWGMFEAAAEKAESSKFRPLLALGHLGAMVVFVLQSQSIYGNAASSAAGLIWLGSGVVGGFLAALACLPLNIWMEALATAGPSLGIAALVAVVAAAGARVSRELWEPATKITFWMVQQLLNPFLSITTDPSIMRLMTPTFSVRVAPECSGLEGMGLMLTFGSVWLWLFRREFRFPRALALVPAGIVVVFLLNAVRIAVLMMIGAAGARAVATGGFHSQAGWIVFNFTAFGFAVVARRIAWFRSATATPASVPEVSVVSEAANPVAPYLMPFLAILAAGIVATASSAGFEWLYPLRLFACVAMLWVFRAQYRTLDWRFSWVGIAAGVGVFALWIAVDRMLFGPGASAMPNALAQASGSARLVWIAIRIFAAAVTVPIAEELAFRAFLLRRIQSAEFELVDPSRAGWLAIAGSSVVFGLMHGSLWHAGIVAGVVYAMVYRMRRSIGEAVVAHGVTNALIAVYVVMGPHWRLW